MRIGKIEKFNFLNITGQKRQINKNQFATTPEVSKINSNINFCGFPCTTDSFMPRKLYDIPCASCGEVTLQPRQIENFVKEAKDLRGEKLIAELQKKNNFFRPFEAKLVNKLIEEAKEHNDLDLNGLVSELNEKTIENLKETQINILNKIKDTAKSLKKDEYEEISGFVKLQEELIKNPKYEEDKYFKRLDFMNSLLEKSKNIKNGGIFKKILLLADTIPSSSNSESAFYVSYSRKSNEEIARRLISPSIATTEHMLPVSKGGKNESSNYIVMCGDCNSRRSSIPYTEWLKSQPHLVENLNNYLSEIDLKITEGMLGYEYIGYPEEAHKAFEEQLGKKIPQFTKKSIVQELSEWEENQDEISYLQENIELLTNLVAERKSDLSDLKSLAEVYKVNPKFEFFQMLEKQEELLKNLKNKRKEIEKQKEEFKRKVEMHEKKQVRSEACRAELESCTDQKRASELREEIKKISYDTEKHQEYLKKYEESHAEYVKIQDSIKQITSQIEEIRKQIILPEDYDKMRKELEVMLNSRKELRLKIKGLENEKNTLNTVVLNVANLTKRLEKVQKQISSSEFANETSILDNEFVKEYIDLENKLKYIMDTNPEALLKQDKLNNLKMLQYIFGEAKGALEKRIANLVKTREVKYYLSLKEKEKLELEIASIKENKNKMALIDEKITELEAELEKMIKILSDEELEKKYKETKEEEGRTSELLKNLNIEDKIKKAESQLDSLNATIDNLRKKLNKLTSKNQVNE